MGCMSLASIPQPQWDDELPKRPAPTTGLAVVDYLRRIHWWIRLFGVLFAISMAFSLIGVILFVLSMGQAAQPTGY